MFAWPRMLMKNTKAIKISNTLLNKLIFKDVYYPAAGMEKLATQVRTQNACKFGKPQADRKKKYE